MWILHQIKNYTTVRVWKCRFLGRCQYGHFCAKWKTMYKTMKVKQTHLDQWFSNLSMKYPQHCTLCMSPYIWQPLQVLQSPLMSWWVESGVIDEGYSRTGLRTTDLDYVWYRSTCSKNDHGLCCEFRAWKHCNSNDI